MAAFVICAVAVDQRGPWQSNKRAVICQKASLLVASADRSSEVIPATSSERRRKWACMPGCGACCFLGDYDLPVIEELFRDADDVEQYMNLIGPDGWCIHLNKETRACQVYNQRPRFCRVELDVFRDLHGVSNEAELDEFAIECCEFHIDEIYPALSDDNAESPEMKKFKTITSVGGAGNML